MESRSRKKTARKSIRYERLYSGEDKMDLLHVKGKSPLNKDFLLARIRQLNTRAKAIYIVPLKKQGKWHNKRLNLEKVQAVQDYIREYNLMANDYLVGRVNQKGIYESILISETAYRKRMKKWTGFAPYNFCKT